MKQFLKLGIPLSVACGFLFYAYAENADGKAKAEKVGWIEPVV